MCGWGNSGRARPCPTRMQASAPGQLPFPRVRDGPAPARDAWRGESGELGVPGSGDIVAKRRQEERRR
jgi:hypothetical protein